MDDIEVEITQCDNSIVTLDSNSATVSGGYLSAGDYALRAELTAVSGGLQSQIDGISVGSVSTGSLTGNFYPRFQNPSGYLWSGESGRFYPVYNPLSFSTSGNLTSASGILQNQIDNLSITGNFASDQDISNLQNQISNSTKIQVSGSSYISGLLNLTGVGGLQVSLSGGNIITFSGGGGGITNTGTLTGEFISKSNQDSIISGLPLNIDNAYQNFNILFSSIPKVFCQIEVSGSNPQYSVNARDITTSGYVALFSDFIQEDGIKLHTFAKT